MLSSLKKAQKLSSANNLMWLPTLLMKGIWALPGDKINFYTLN
jgi:hypothetical protein